MPPELWKIVPLGEYAKVIMGQSPESDYYTDDPQEMPFLQGNRTFGLKYPTFDTYTSKVTKIAPKNSVLISVRAPVGDVNVAPTELCLGRGVASLESEDPDNEFLYYLMKNQSAQLNQNENGSTFGSINRSDLQRLPVLLPDYDTRRKIGHILATIDTKINRNQSINDNLATVRDSIFLNWLNSKIDKDIVSPTPSIGYKSLSQLCRKITDGSHFSPESDSNGKHAMFSVKDMGEYGFNRNDCKMINEESYEMMKSSGCVPEKDDVLIAKDGSYLKQIFLVDSTTDDAILSSIAIFRPDLNVVYPEILLSYLKSPAVYNYVKDNFVSGSAVPRIVLKSFKQLNLAVPSIEDQNEIIESLRSIRFEIASNLMILNKLIELRDYLLPKLMSGEIDVSPLGLPTKYSFSTPNPEHEQDHQRGAKSEIDGED